MIRRLALVAVCLILLSGICAAEEMKKLKVGEITITYPPDLEKEAEEVAKVADEVLPPKFKEHREFGKKLSGTKGIAGRIVEILGCPEYTRDAEEMLDALCKSSVDMPLVAFRDLRLYRKADIVKAGKMTVGAIEIRYLPEDDSYGYYYHYEASTSGSASKPELHVPLAFDDKGAFAGKKPLAQGLAANFDEWSFSPLISLHEVAEGILLARLRLYHPFTRWFNDGAASWVALKLVPEIAPEKEERAKKAFLPSEESKALRSKVNLYAWPQEEYSKANPSKDEEKLSSACYGYSTELIGRLVNDQTPSTMAAIIHKLKSGDTTPDTDRICRAVKEVTGKDCRAMLLEYMPEDVRKDLLAGKAEELKEQAWQAFHTDKDNRRAVECLTKAVEIEPNDPDTQFNLAFLMRKVGGMEDESVRHAKIAAGLISGKGTHQFRHYDPDDPESMYLMGRMNQYAGDLEMAETIFRVILEKYPDHADSKKALEEMGR